jgi:hypothetical protein
LRRQVRPNKQFLIAQTWRDDLLAGGADLNAVFSLYFNTPLTIAYGRSLLCDVTSVTDRPFFTNALLMRYDK